MKMVTFELKSHLNLPSSFNYISFSKKDINTFLTVFNQMKNILKSLEDDNDKAVLAFFKNQKEIDSTWVQDYIKYVKENTK